MGKTNLDYFYNSERDEEYISDYEQQICCVKEYKHVTDADDLARWRQRWLPSCRVCPRQRFCYASHQMQKAYPPVVV